jgi:glutamate--cysteine ligase
MLTTRRLSRAHVDQAVAELFTSSPPLDRGAGTPGFVGVELEWIPARPALRPPGTVGVPRLKELLSTRPDLVSDARLTFEPGGQIEISPRPSPSVSHLMTSITALSAALRDTVRGGGIGLFTSGVNPWHSLEELGLQTPAPRYTSMQAHFDAIGPAGRGMMRQTASLQICLDLGGPDVAIDRWRVANLAGPALAAAFANSPVLAGVATGTPGTRSGLWQRVDASRTGFDGRQVGPADLAEAARAYADFALRAEFIRLPESTQASPAHPWRRSFEAWLGADVRGSDQVDLTFHLSTLFPPVRPRHHLEVRYIDALPERWLAVPIALLATLLYEPAASREALELLGDGLPDLSAWERSATLATGDPALLATARDLFRIAIRAFPRLPTGYLPDHVAALVAEYSERFPESGRCPADEQLAHFVRDKEDLSTWR